MNPSKYLIPTFIAGFFSITSWLVVITKINPYQSTEIGLILFFISLFFALVSIFTILGFYIRTWINKKEIQFNYLNISLRQAILLAFCALGCLSFLLLGVLTWWGGLLLVVIITLIEFYLTAKE